MKIGVKKVITNFWNWEQVEPKPMSPPKTHFSASKNTNDNFTKSLLMDFFTDFWGTFCCQFWESSTSWPARRSNLDGAIFHTHVNRTGTIWRKKSESISVWKRDIVGFVHNAQRQVHVTAQPKETICLWFLTFVRKIVLLLLNPSHLTVNADVNGRSLEDWTPSNWFLSTNANIPNLLKKDSPPKFGRIIRVKTEEEISELNRTIRQSDLVYLNLNSGVA